MSESKNEPLTRGVPKDTWSTPFSAFNSMKYLMWREHIESIIEGKFKPPYMVDIDPSNVCNYDMGKNTGCIWCNSRAFRQEKPQIMPMGHLSKIADFLKEWGVKSACIGGGGENMVHPEFASFLWKMHKNGIKTGIISNGSLLDFEKSLAIVKCSSWCGLSIDAGTSKTFNKVHGLPDTSQMFDKVINNMKNLIKIKDENNSNVEITYKYLMHPENAHEILNAVELARDIGCNTFHLRPACVDNLYGQDKNQIKYSKTLIDKINQQMEKAKDFETDVFKFYGIRHKFNPDFTRKVNFKRCLATPLMATFCADGTITLCFDLRGKWTLCNHYPHVHEILDVWGGKKHKQMIENIKVDECPRCTMSTVNEIIEQVFIKDKMYRDFL